MFPYLSGKELIAIKITMCICFNNKDWRNNFLLHDNVFKIVENW